MQALVKTNSPKEVVEFMAEKLRKNQMLFVDTAFIDDIEMVVAWTIETDIKHIAKTIDEGNYSFNSTDTKIKKMNNGHFVLQCEFPGKYKNLRLGFTIYNIPSIKEIDLISSVYESHET
jgi:hypothetical protein